MKDKLWSLHLYKGLSLKFIKIAMRVEQIGEKQKRTH